MSKRGMNIHPAKNPNTHEANISLSHHTDIFLKYSSEALCPVFNAKKFLLILLNLLHL